MMGFEFEFGFAFSVLVPPAGMWSERIPHGDGVSREGGGKRNTIGGCVRTSNVSPVSFRSPDMSKMQK